MKKIRKIKLDRKVNTKNNMRLQGNINYGWIILPDSGFTTYKAINIINWLFIQISAGLLLRIKYHLIFYCFIQIIKGK